MIGGTVFEPEGVFVVALVIGGTVVESDAGVFVVAGVIGGTVVESDAGLFVVALVFVYDMGPGSVVLDWLP